MMKKKSLNAAFTLIELLVVITIIGILAGIALPVFSQVQERAQQTKSLAGAKQIGLALKLWAGDNDGNFPVSNGDPTGATTPTGTGDSSNQIFANLFPTYVSAEKLFYTPKSAYCNKTPPDEVYNTTTTCLAAGENEYAYMTGLTDTSNAALPLLFDGLSGTGSSAKYDTNRNSVGGVWGGKKAIIIHVDDSGEVATCDTVKLVPTRTPSTGGAKVSIFDTSDANWLSSTANLIKNPLPAAAAAGG